MLTDLKIENLNLIPIEKKIIEERIDGVSFEQIEEKNMRASIDQIMIRGAAITGCSLPNTEFFAEFISSEIEKFILEFGFSTLTLNEILLALRLNELSYTRFPSGFELESVAFTGVCFNVSFLSKVLRNYMALRNLLDRKLQNQIDGFQ